MNDFDRDLANDTDSNPNSDDEINRIQSEIDKQLVPQDLVDSSDLIDSNDLAEPNDLVDFNDSDMENGVIISTDVSSENASAEPLQKSFYNETVKNASGAKNKPNLGKVILIACIAGVLIIGGCLIGLGLGIGFASDETKKTKVETQTEETLPDDENAPSDPSSEDVPSFTFEDTPTPTEETATETSPTLSSSQDSVSNHLVGLVKKVEPSVVAVTMVESPLESFIGEESQDAIIGAGSGIIFHEDEEKVYIVTNEHVIRNASEVKVSVEEHEPVTARLVGADNQADIAVISILKQDLSDAGVESISIATFGNSDNIQVGEVVLAIGNALGEGNTATMGIVSAKEKEINIDDTYLTVIQTNAAINFGNSGGPLINMNGEVIGINTAKLSPQSGVEGMGYSISSNIVKPIIEGIMNRTNKPMLGVSGYDITEEISAMYDLPGIGVIVNSVIPGSSADKAGIKRNDIITSVDGETIFSMEQLSNIIRNHSIGDTVEIKIIRNGTESIVLETTLEVYTDVEF